MSKIALTPNASGTGTFTLAAPNSNTSRTITLPDEAGEVLVNTATGIDVTGTVTADAYALDSIALPSAGTATIFNRNTDNNLYIQTDSGNTVYLLDGSQNTMYTASPTSHIFQISNAEKMRIDSSGNVGIGVTPVTSWDTFTALQIEGSALGGLGDNNTILGSNIYHDNNAFKYIGSATASIYQQRLGEHRWYGAASGTAGNTASMTQHMTIDSSGNLLVGKTSTNYLTNGVEAKPDGSLWTTATNNGPLVATRKSSDGNIASFYKDSSFVGSIGVASTSFLTIGGTSANHGGLRFDIHAVLPMEAGTQSDNTIDLGSGSYRYDDVFATNGTIQTSDRNEKQDIEALNDAETRVAVACKGLLRKFRWQDAVAEKGDDARIHFGIIAQDLQDAFAAEGLDAGRYAMFISSTWWETQTDVPAVEAVDAVYEDVIIPAVLDEEGNELEAERTEQQLVTEAVEAKDAYTRTDTYETQAEAPEGATERTRLGVRYPELLAFIIGAM